MMATRTYPQKMISLSPESWRELKPISNRSGYIQALVMDAAKAWRLALTELREALDKGALDARAAAERIRRIRVCGSDVRVTHATSYLTPLAAEIDRGNNALKSVVEDVVGEPV